MILTAKAGKNSDLFPGILKLYVPEGGRVVDVTYGRGWFWKGVTGYEVVGVDLAGINASVRANSRQLPFPPNCFDAVVIDPPYAQGSTTQRTVFQSEYQLGSVRGVEDTLDLYYDMVVEAVRVLKPLGVCIVKCQDMVNSGVQNWMHIEIFNFALQLGMVAEDFFVLVNPNKPVMRHKYQHHARKNCSYFWVFRLKEKPSVQADLF
jgi:hypothetical protein